MEVAKDGKLAKDPGTWMAGRNGNRPALVFPGTPQPGRRC